MLRERRVNAAARPAPPMAVLWCLIVGCPSLSLLAQTSATAVLPPPSQLRLVTEVVPVYPPIALSARVQGRVFVQITVGPNGRVTDAFVVRSVPLVEQAALDAVRQWEFAPLPAGTPPAVATVAVTFSIGQDPRRVTAIAALPPDVPRDFAFSFESHCTVGSFKIDTTSDRLFTTDNPTPVRLELTGEDVAAVYRALDAAGVFASRDGLSASPVAAPTQPDLPEGTIAVTVFGESPFVEVISTHVAARIGYRLTVRSEGWWMEAWPPKPGERSAEYATGINAVRALIARIVEQKDAWRQLPRGARACRDWQGQ